MPYKNNADKLAYQKRYNAQPKAKKARAASNKARALLMKEGLVRKGDGKDVHHKKALRSGGKTERSNITVRSRSQRGWNKK